MINDDVINAFNNRLTVNASNIKTLTVEIQDRVKAHGDTAAALLKNRDLAMFIHQLKFEWCDQLALIKGHTEEDNNKRIAISNKITAIDDFVGLLKQAVITKASVVKANQPPADITT